MNPLYYLEDQFMFQKSQHCFRKRTWYHEKTQAYVIEKWKSLEIDDIDDFKLAEFYSKRLRK